MVIEGFQEPVLRLTKLLHYVYYRGNQHPDDMSPPVLRVFRSWKTAACQEAAATCITHESSASSSLPVETGFK